MGMSDGRVEAGQRVGKHAGRAHKREGHRGAALSVDRTQDYRMTVPKRCMLPSDMCLSPESVTMRTVCPPALMAEPCGLRQL
jgi:hypothetical protein